MNKTIPSLLLQEKSEIISTWETRVRDSLDVARDKSSLILIDHIPYLIDNLVIVLMNDGKRIRHTETQELNRNHGVQRATEAGFSLSEIMTEYSLLRDVIIDLVYAKVPPDPLMAKVFHQFIDDCVHTTVLEFSNYQTHLIRKQARELELEKHMRERFVTALTHDMRTPLTAALMSLGLVNRKSQFTPFQQKNLTRIEVYLNRLNSMIQDFLDFSLFKAGGKPAMETSVFNLNELVRETVNDLIVIHGDRFILTECELGDISLNEKSLKRIIENLCNNAVKYGDQHEKIEIKIYRTNNVFGISIHNKGPVIDKETFEKLFHFFSRSREAWKNTNGWGIGLPLVKGLTDAMGGEVKVSSTKENGTTFLIEFPIEKSS